MKPQKINTIFKCRTSLRVGVCNCNDKCVGCHDGFAAQLCEKDCNRQNQNPGRIEPHWPNPTNKGDD